MSLFKDDFSTLISTLPSLDTKEYSLLEQYILKILDYKLMLLMDEGKNLEQTLEELYCFFKSFIHNYLKTESLSSVTKSKCHQIFF